jgi:hypothetical protein
MDSDFRDYALRHPSDDGRPDRKNDVETGLLDFLIYVHQNWR